jgi:amidohydrolase
MPMLNTASMLERAKELQNEIVQIRHHLHAIPELSFEEYLTAEFVAEHLDRLGYSVRRQVGKTGVVADIGSGTTMIAVRAEMDGLAIGEQNRAIYASKHHGASHACGHDVNMACVLGAAQLLSERVSTCNGRVRIIMQPAAEESSDEHGQTGTVRMIDEGAIEGVAAIIALHVDATMPPGNVAVLADPFLISPNQFVVRIEAEPTRQDFNAILAAARVVQSLHESSQGSKVLISSFQSTTADLNIASGLAVLQGSFKTPNKETREVLVDEMHKALKSVQSSGGKYKIEFAHGSSQLPRHQEVVDAMYAAACDLIGTDKVKLVSRKTWTEDFSGFTRHLPGSLMLLGGEIAGNRRICHSPTFDVDESGFYVGSAVLSATVLLLMDIFG